MDVKYLSEALRDISLKAGVGGDEDFEGVSPLDIVASYCVALSGGRIIEDKDILARVSGCGNVEHFLKSVSRGKVPVPTPEQIEAVQSGQLDEYKPAPPKPSRDDLFGAASRKELKRRKRLDWKAFYADTQPEGLESALARIDRLDWFRAVAELIKDHGTDLAQNMGHLGTHQAMETMGPDEFIKKVTKPYKEMFG